ncbi:MAG TPA: hypothetical protein VIL55_14210 [Naasia sp.]|jgi:hypothetical protein
MALWDLPRYLDMAVLPLEDWSGTVRPLSEARRSPFSAGTTSTFQLLRAELDALDAEERVLYVPVEGGQFRRDGRPRADAKLVGAALVLAFDAGDSPYEYVSDQWLTWQENLRAIALTLQALRAVARYGLTAERQQYVGFRALEAPQEDPAIVWASVAEALGWLRDLTGVDESVPIRSLLVQARRKSHPDLGGDGSLFGRVSDAEALLRREGLL